MHSFFSKFRRSSSANVTNEKKSKSNSKDDNQLNPTSVVYHNQKQIYENRQGSNKAVKPTLPVQSKAQQFSISISKSSHKRKDSKSSITKQPVEENSPNFTNNNVNTRNKEKDLDIFGIIVDPINTAEPLAKASIIQIFDPEPAPEEADTTNQTTYIDDRNFIFDDDEDVKSEKSYKSLEDMAKENNCFTINEVPEGRLSRLSSRSSRASSIGSDSTRASSNILESANNERQNGEIKNGSKNILLDALIKKFNVSMDVDTTDNVSDRFEERDSDMVSDSSNGQAKTSSLIKKQPLKYHGEDHKRKQQSELQRKINRSNHNKSTGMIADTTLDRIDASSSLDDTPKQIKIVKSSSTQVTQTLAKRNKSYRTINVTRLPQNFECKYIGKTRCTGLWGLKHIRDPVDYLVTTSRQLKSLEELPNVEALISEKGIYIVQKERQITELEKKFRNDTSLAASLQAELLQVDLKIPQLTKEASTEDKKSILTEREGQGIATERYYKSGLLPISNISYAVQDNLYGKVFSCIIVRECEGKTISECYSFLCKQNEIARRMALSITLAFKEYGKLLQLKETRINRKIEIHDGAPGETNKDSYA